MTAISPSPLPGKTPPVLPPLEGPQAWGAKPLVSATMTFNVNGSPKSHTSDYVGLPFSVYGNGDLNMIDRTSPVFQPIAAASFADAVEAASLLSATARLNTNGVDSPDSRERVHPAVGVLQAASGSWFTTALAPPNRSNSLSVDSPSKTLTSVEVTQLHPDLKAVVGPYSWVNFTDEQITPQLSTTAT